MINEYGIMDKSADKENLTALVKSTIELKHKSVDHILYVLINMREYNYYTLC